MSTRRSLFTFIRERAENLIRVCSGVTSGFSGIQYGILAIIWN